MEGWVDLMSQWQLRFCSDESSMTRSKCNLPSFVSFPLIRTPKYFKTSVPSVFRIAIVSVSNIVCWSLKLRILGKRACCLGSRLHLKWHDDKIRCLAGPTDWGATCWSLSSFGSQTSHNWGLNTHHHSLSKIFASGINTGLLYGGK